MFTLATTDSGILKSIPKNFILHHSHSTITNPVAYRFITPDFELWSRTRGAIQRVHLEHFFNLVVTSRHKRFNVKQQLAGTSWYSAEALPSFLKLFGAVMESSFVADDAIKPVLSYLVAHLHNGLCEATSGLSSPASVLSQIDNDRSREKAEQLFGAFVSILSDSPDCYTRFSATLPLTRIYLLLLGDKPSKFELVSGWTIVKTVLPGAWDPNVHAAAFGILLGRDEGQYFVSVNGRFLLTRTLGADGQSATYIEAILEELVQLQSSCPTFRELFESQQTTQTFTQVFQSFVARLSPNEISRHHIRITKKLMHFTLTLALDNAVAGRGPKSASAEQLLNGGDSQQTKIDPSLVSSRFSVRHRFSSARLSFQLGERTVQKSMARIHEWRVTVIATERKRLRKNLLDLKEQNRRVSRLSDWMIPLTAERGLWEVPHLHYIWQMDETVAGQAWPLDSDLQTDTLLHPRGSHGERWGGIISAQDASQSLLFVPVITRRILDEDDITVDVIRHCIGALVVNKLATDINARALPVNDEELACLSSILGTDGQDVTRLLSHPGAIQFVNMGFFAKKDIFVLPFKGATSGVPDMVLQTFSILSRTLPAQLNKEMWLNLTDILTHISKGRIVLDMCLKNLWHFTRAYIKCGNSIPLLSYVYIAFTHPEITRGIHEEGDAAAHVLRRCVEALVINKLATDINTRTLPVNDEELACLSSILGTDGQDVTRLLSHPEKQKAKANGSSRGFGYRFSVPHLRAALETRTRHIGDTGGHLDRVLRHAEAFRVVAPNLAALARGLSRFTPTCFQYKRTHIQSFEPRRSLLYPGVLPIQVDVYAKFCTAQKLAPNLAAPVRGLDYLNQLRFQFRRTLRQRRTPRRSVAPRKSVRNCFRRPSTTRPSRLRVDAPNLTAPARGLSNWAHTRLRSLRTHIRHFVPRGGLHDQCSARRAGKPESGPERQHNGNSGAQQYSMLGPSQAGAKPRSRLGPGQSRGFQAKPGRNITTGAIQFVNMIFLVKKDIFVFPFKGATSGIPDVVRQTFSILSRTLPAQLNKEMWLDLTDILMHVSKGRAYIERGNSIPLPSYICIAFTYPEITRRVHEEGDVAAHVLRRCVEALIVNKLATDINGRTPPVSDAKLGCLSSILDSERRDTLGILSHALPARLNAQLQQDQTTALFDISDRLSGTLEKHTIIILIRYRLFPPHACQSRDHPPLSDRTGSCRPSDGMLLWGPDRNGHVEDAELACISAILGIEHHEELLSPHQLRIINFQKVVSLLSGEIDILFTMEGTPASILGTAQDTLHDLANRLFDTSRECGALRLGSSQGSNGEDIKTTAEGVGETAISGGAITRYGDGGLISIVERKYVRGWDTKYTARAMCGIRGIDFVQRSHQSSVEDRLAAAAQPAPAPVAARSPRGIVVPGKAAVHIPAIHRLACAYRAVVRSNASRDARYHGCRSQPGVREGALGVTRSDRGD
ncbi:hypothetical protein EDB84DRAFT_1440213 [Lactarius hengduanensis]|nr:hypothetical protein EDB84DRAFT_1440213 [Lactarius hengduanensis]